MNPSSAAPQPVNFPSQNPSPNPNLTPNPTDLSAALSSLKTLVSFCHLTLENVNVFPPKPRNDNFLPCPCNPNHLMPPESLFLHTLRCPFPLNLDPPNYQSTLQSSSLLDHQKTHFTIQDSNQELCFSLDDYLSNLGSFSFYYQYCPAVVALSDIDASRSGKTFTLPGILSVECANVVCFGDGEAEYKIDGFDEIGFRFLASDLWFMRREVESWGDYEHINMYSFNVFCAILGLRTVKESDLSQWVIVNSPRYGLVIDVYMRDHIFALVGLCLKAVIREALGFVELVKSQDLERGLKSMSFKCPVLNQVLRWLASQLCVLYGQVNGKFFAIEIFKQCILGSTSELYPLEQSLTESSDLKEVDQSLHASPSDIRDEKVKEPLERNTKCGLDKWADETIGRKVIFVSQVAAAVAALHERSLLEEKIRALRGSQSLTSYQRMAEHTYLSSRADEERKKRANYRPIIEHDGLPRQRSSNEGTNKTKTREEVLAEERDYKRRRMSYRGKKVKRTSLQVVRDIIEEYMEEIKEAGGIGCFEKGDQDRGTFPSKSHTHDLSMDTDDGRTNNNDLFESARGSPNCYTKQSHLGHHIKSTSVKDALPRDRERSKWGLQEEHGQLEELRSSVDREKHGDYYAKSTERRRSHDRSHGRSSHRREREDVELTRTKHHEVKRLSSSSSNYHHYRPSYSASNSRQRNMQDHHSTEDSLVKSAFEDRYDPSESHNMYEDDVSNGGEYVNPE